MSYTHKITPRYHGLSIDVEDWFHILECEQSPSVSDWNKLDSRINQNIEKILKILYNYNVCATFFIVGWVATQHPSIVQQICNQGHEIGSHGHLHTMVSHLKPDEFARDLDRSLTAISRATHQDVLAYRAPGFSITNLNSWAFEILASRGIKIDSSLFIGPHAHGGISLDRVSPFEIILPSGHKLIEFPVVSFSFLKQRLPFAGGGYLRLLPTPIVKQMFRLSEKRGSTIIMYVHPRDFDPDQPRLPLSKIRSFKYYVGLKNFSKKFENLLATFQFKSFNHLGETQTLDQPLFLKDFYDEDNQLVKLRLNNESKTN